MAEQFWDLTIPPLPPRSRLFHLAPIGVGTADVESLTGYVARLAEAHSVRPGDLIRQEVLPLMGRPGLVAPGNNGLCSFWHRHTPMLNGMRTLARDLVHALETLTLRRELRFLTFLPWAEVMWSEGLLRQRLAWCPACYEEWRLGGKVIYEPLIWTVRLITACPRHRQRLQMACPYQDCRQPLHPLAPRARPGYCSRCERWLGGELAEVTANNEALAANELKVQAWLMQAVGEMLAAAPSFRTPLPREALAEAISACAGAMTGGDVSVLAAKLGFHQTRVEIWQRGQRVTSLETLLRCCSRLGLSPVYFLTGDVGGAVSESGVRPVLDDLPTRPPSERRRFPVTTVRRVLEAILARKKWRPPSLNAVSKRLGYDPSTIREKLPEQCRAISARYAEHRKAQGLRRRERILADVRRATLKVHERGLYPSSSRVAPLLRKPGSMRDLAVYAAWRETLRELGYDR